MESFIWKETGSCGWPAAGFEPEKAEGYPEFCRENAYWLEDYSLFMALKEAHGGKSWDHWEEPLRKREPKRFWRSAGRIRERSLITGLNNICSAGSGQAPSLCGGTGNRNHWRYPDLCGFDSADTGRIPNCSSWMRSFTPVAVAGCPPDAFSATGQLWGNPLYDWKHHAGTGYQWWISRIAWCLKLLRRSPGGSLPRI